MGKGYFKNNELVFLFSGQGSQYYQMGADLFKKNKIFQQWMQHLDLLVQKYADISIIDEIYGNKPKGALFDNILISHPALFMVQFSLGRLLLENNVKPKYFMGTSLGEYVSLALANCVDYEQILKLLVEEAKIFRKATLGGTMLTILSEKKFVDKILNSISGLDLVADNYDKHHVISGNENYINLAIEYLKSEKIDYYVLPVPVGFHSRNVDYAKNELIGQLKGISFREPEVQIFSCTYVTRNPEITTEYLWDIIRKPILFKESISSLTEFENLTFIDLGPGGTLAGFVKKDGVIKHNKIYSILSPFGGDVGRIEDIIDTFQLIENNKHSLHNKIAPMKAYVFPGQGSQKKGMGEGLFEEYKEITRKADEILGYSIKELCLNDPENKLGKTQFTQPALFTVNALNYLKKSNENDLPDYVAGHSLGEYNALLASGVFDFETGLKLVKKRGELMSKAKDGGMAAVIGMTEDKIKDILMKEGLVNIDIANLNSPSQIVISGPKNDIVNAQSIFEANGCKMYIQLPVSGAFHSRLMEEASKEFEDFINQFQFSSLKIPVISNVFARPYNNNNIRQLLIDQITHSVKWTESVCYLMGKGVQEFIEIGPGNVLTGMINKIKKEAEPLIVKEKEVFEKSSVNEKNSHYKIEQTNVIKEEIHINSEIKEIKSSKKITIMSLGNKEFKQDYNLKYPYICGGMYRGISSVEIVIKLGKAGMMGFFGSGGLSIDIIGEAIKQIQEALGDEFSYGINVVHNPSSTRHEENLIDLLLLKKVKVIEAAAYLYITPAIVRYKVNGLIKSENGDIIANNKIIAKISRPEVAKAFMSSPPQNILNQLVNEGKITEYQASLAKNIPVADDICAESDSAGHTDQAVAYALFPAIAKLRDEMMKLYKYKKRIRIGTAGGIGTPEAASAAFILGADFILTGSINQCTVEAGTSNEVKDMLQEINIQDTDYAPAGDMFEIGAKVQVLKKGVFFPARASKLYDLYRLYDCIDKIDSKTQEQIQQKYFKRSFESVYEDVRNYYPPEEIARAEENPKYKMSLIFRWYFNHSSQLALSGNKEEKVNYQIPCGPALGAFNQWIKGSSLENWRNRHVDEISIKIMEETADFIDTTFSNLCKNAN